jgi:hypothetical protein
MLHSLSAPPDLIEKLPDPDAVRERLSCAVREVQLLRQLLRLAERAARDRQRSGAHTGETPCP